MNKGISINEIINKSSLSIKSGNPNEKGFHKIPNTTYSLQNVDANIAGKAIILLAKEYDIRIEIEFRWRDKPGRAEYPNESCIISN